MTTKTNMVTLPYTHGIYTVAIAPPIKDDWPTDVYRVTNNETNVVETQTPNMLEALQFAIFQSDTITALLKAQEEKESLTDTQKAFKQIINPTKQH